MTIDDEDSTDLTDAEVEGAIPTSSSQQMVELLKEALSEGVKVESYALRRRNHHLYCRVVLTEGTLVFQVDWI